MQLISGYQRVISLQGHTQEWEPKQIDLGSREQKRKVERWEHASFDDIWCIDRCTWYRSNAGIDRCNDRASIDALHGNMHRSMHIGASFDARYQNGKRKVDIYKYVNLGLFFRSDFDLASLHINVHHPSRARGATYGSRSAISSSKEWSGSFRTWARVQPARGRVLPVLIDSSSCLCSTRGMLTDLIGSMHV